jgi:hypothetical protein
MPKNPRNTVETMQGLAVVGVEIGAIVTRESIKNTSLLGRYVARQGMSALQTSLEAATNAADRYGLSKRRDEYTEGSIKQAMGEAVEAVGDDPKSQSAASKVGIFATKLSCAHDLINEVRIVVDDPTQPDILISTDTIKQQYLEDFGVAVEIKGIHPDDVQFHKTELQEQAGIEVYPPNEAVANAEHSRLV